jgi:hypothetical protein
MQKVGQQAVGPPADLTAHPLNAQPVVAGLGADPAPVPAPADQTVAGLAVRMRAALGQLNITGGTDFRLGVLFDG